jgi:hypothetical protein
MDTSRLPHGSHSQRGNASLFEESPPTDILFAHIDPLVEKRCALEAPWLPPFRRISPPDNAISGPITAWATSLSQ